MDNTDNTDNTDKSILLGLPLEVREMIWIYSVSSTDVIEPVPVEDRPHSYAMTPSVRTMIQLSMTCRQVYQEVCESGIFYKHASFRFSSPKATLDYLVTIIPNRRNSIQSVGVQWFWVKDEAHSFNMLATCRSLRYLKVEINLYAVSLYLESLAVFRQLRTLNVEIFAPDPWKPISATEQEASIIDRLKTVVATAEESPLTNSMIKAAKNTASVKIHGEHRVKQPDLISHRTRFFSRI